MLNSSYKVKRDLLTKMSYIRNTDGGLVVQRNYTYDKLGRPLTRQTLRSGGAMNETFDYNDCSESARRLSGRLDKSAAFAPKGENCRRLEGRLAKSDRFCPKGVRSRRGDSEASVDGARPSQIIHATRTVGDSFDYAYDNIGNRVTAQEVNSGATSDIAYVTNDLNQYTQIDTNGSDFTPEYDEDGNQTLIQTETGIWRVTYNVQNRAVRFENESSGTVITCDYDYLGRRVFKKVEKDGVVTSHEHYLYRGYLQIASLDMMEGQNQALINAYVWDPTQPVATRPLVIIYKGSAYYYGWDLTKNITEIFSLSARLQIDYVYTPFGQVRENGIIPQSARRLAGRLDKSAAFAPKGRDADGAAVSHSIQWSSEYHDAETGLVYYNYRYYNPRDGRWTRREPIEKNSGVSSYGFCFLLLDYLGLLKQWSSITFLQARSHYQNGQGESVQISFDLIDTSSVSVVEDFKDVKEWLESQRKSSKSCEKAEKEFEDARTTFKTTGQAAFVLGTITLKFIGKVSVECDCHYEVNGELRAYDDKYDFDQHKGKDESIRNVKTRLAEIIHGKGTPYTIEIRGGRSVSIRGVI